MKHLFIITIICVYTSGFSQTISTKETKEKFSTGMQTAISTTIYGNQIDEVINEWKKLLKDFKNEKVKDKNDEVFGDNVVIKDWGNNTVDIFTKFEGDKKENLIKMSVAVDLGGKYLNSEEKDKFAFIEKMTKEFAIKMTKAPLELEIKNGAKLLSKFENQEKDLMSERRGLLVDIENYKSKIKKAEEDIKKAEENQAKKKDEIEEQKKSLELLNKKLEAIN